MKNSKKNTSTAVIVDLNTLTYEVLKRKNTKALQGLSKKLNLNLTLGKKEFSREQLIDNILSLKSAPAITAVQNAGRYTAADLDSISDAELATWVHELGFDLDVENTTREAMIEAILTYKGTGAVFTAPADKKGKAAKAESPAIVALNTIPVGIKFRYPTAKVDYEVIEKDEKGAVKIKNLKSEGAWFVRKPEELTKGVILV